MHKCVSQIQFPHRACDPVRKKILIIILPNITRGKCSLSQECISEDETSVWSKGRESRKIPELQSYIHNRKDKIL